MFDVALYEPEIPPNTGNIIRLCANTGTTLHLIHPLGFALDDARLKRAGLDYHEWADIKAHTSYEIFVQIIEKRRLFACSTKGKVGYNEPNYLPGDIFLFGPETRGLPNEILSGLPPAQIIRIPMLANSRSLNLSNAAAIIVYEAWRQNDFKDEVGAGGTSLPANYSPRPCAKALNEPKYGVKW